MRGEDTLKLDISKLLNISARVSWAITVACVFILFFPSDWLPFQIDTFREQYGLWIFIVLAVAISLCLSHAAKWIWEKVKQAWDKKKTWDTYKYILKNLSKSEKAFLKKYYDKRETAILVDLRNPTIKKLETFRVISKAAGTSLGSVSGFPGFIQPWVFELIDKNPEFLNIVEDDKE